MITLFRWYLMKTKEIKWRLALWQFVDQQANELLDVFETHFLSFVSSYITAKFHNYNREASFYGKSNLDVFPLNLLCFH